MHLEIEKLTDTDLEYTVRFFEDIIDEVHAHSPEIDRVQFKSIYSVEEIKKVQDNRDSVYLVGKIDSKIVCFLFGSVSEDIGNIYWIGVKKRERKKYYGTMIVKRAIKEFEMRNCHEVRLFTIQRIGLKMFETCGFNEITYINKHFFGINLIQMVCKLKIPEIEPYTKNIIISGEAGQGIKLVAHSLASILNKLGKEVVLNLIYDARVTGGNITAELIYSDTKIESPFFKEADIAIQLSNKLNPLIRAKKMLVDEESNVQDLTKTNSYYMESIKVPFKSMANEHFQSPIFVNMIALGNLLKLIGIEISQINFEAEFPARFLNENIKAVKYGYAHRDWL